ncbi:hypothetical protein F2P81_007592 [Scophthalmus maximus]|uniref:Uncharacterized protein n=1 Tax=Scophthalmus maximus TaxID=52904 RepID=A0A6A4T040_SCOMX|nr:hypothetical protein F2P81_007592 [Scophthalmus maximus]
MSRLTAAGKLTYIIKTQSRRTPPTCYDVCAYWFWIQAKYMQYVLVHVACRILRHLLNFWLRGKDIKLFQKHCISISAVIGQRKR